MVKKIGIDLDNTIINYEIPFKKFLRKNNIKVKKVNKSRLKELINKNQKFKSWTQVQEEIYGKYIVSAKKFKYYKSFENFALKHKFKLFIISHKTKYSQYSKKYNLHKISNLWLQKNIKIKNYKIYFLNSIESKLNKIRKINPDYFIDDLLEILTNKKMPKKIKRIYFSEKNDSVIKNFNNWHKIKKFIKKNENLK